MAATQQRLSADRSGESPNPRRVRSAQPTPGAPKATRGALKATRGAPKAAHEEPRARGGARREALLEAVLRIVTAVGIDAVTHRRVAEEAGLPLASTTYYFDSKEHLLTAALELAAERDTRRLLDFTASALKDGHLGPEAAVDAAVDAIAGPLDEGLGEGRGKLTATYALLLEGARRPAMQDIAARWTEAYLLALGQLLEMGGSRHPRVDAELLLGAADGLIVEQLAAGGTIDLRHPLQRLAVALLAAP